jgi:hypothetical protein
MALGCDGAGEMCIARGSATLVTGDGPPSLVTSNTVVAAGPRTLSCVTAAQRLRARSLWSIARRGAALPHPSALKSRRRRRSPYSPRPHRVDLARWSHSRAVSSEREAIFVDCGSGTGQGISSIAGDFQSFVWSTDSRYLFYIARQHKLMCSIATLAASKCWGEQRLGARRPSGLTLVLTSIVEGLSCGWTDRRPRR